MRTARRPTLVAVLLLSLLSLACGAKDNPTQPTGSSGDNGGNPDNDGSTGTTGTVVGTATPSGGTVSGANGVVKLEFPAGAVSQNVEITVDAATDAPASSDLVAGSTYTFGPDGLTFQQPVALTVSYDPSKVPAGRTQSSLGLYNASGSSWDEVQSVQVDTVAHTVTGWISHFSTYGVKAGRVENIDGDWFVKETVTSDECQNEVGKSYVYSVTILQTGADIKVNVNGEVFSGVVDGSVVTWTGSYVDDEDGGTVEVSLRVDIDAGGDHFTGRDRTTFEGGGTTCSGTSVFDGTRASSDKPAKITISAAIDNVPQPDGQPVTVRPDVGEDLEIDVHAYDASGQEMNDLPVNVQSTDGHVVDFGLSGMPTLPLVGFHPEVGIEGTATLKVLWIADDETVEGTLPVTVSRTTTPVILRPADGSVIPGGAAGFTIIDDNPEATHWQIMRNGKVLDTYHAYRYHSDCSGDGCPYTPTNGDELIPPGTTGFPYMWTVDVEGLNIAEDVVSKTSITYHYTAWPSRAHWEMDGEDPVTQYDQLVIAPTIYVNVPEFLPGVPFNIPCPDTDNPAEPLVMVTLDYDIDGNSTDFYSGKDPDHCGGQIMIAPTPQTYTNGGEVWMIQFQALVTHVGAGGLDTRNVTGYIEYTHNPGFPDTPSWLGVGGQ